MIKHYLLSIDCEPFDTNYDQTINPMINVYMFLTFINNNTNSPVFIFILQASIKYWLPFIRAMHGQLDEKPQVILVGTHVDKAPNMRRAP